MILLAFVALYLHTAYTVIAPTISKKESVTWTITAFL